MAEIKNNFKCGKCSRCGECCGAVPLPITRMEEKRIRRYIKEHNIPYQETRLWKDEVGNVNEDLRCVFYDFDNKKCKIYEVRPSICRRFRCNMSLQNIEINKIVHHERAYWNEAGIEGDFKHLTNFNLLFYGRIAPLFKWFISNFRTEFNINPPESIDATLHIFELGGIKVDKELQEKLNKELREDDERSKLL